MTFPNNGTCPSIWRSPEALQMRSPCFAKMSERNDLGMPLLEYSKHAEPQRMRSLGMLRSHSESLGFGITDCLAVLLPAKYRA